MPSDDNLDALFNAAVYDWEGEKIGPVVQVYLSNADRMPSWLTVKTGLFGTTEIFVPVDGATMRSGRITVPYSARFVNNAPNLGADIDLAGHEEGMLYEYYGIDWQYQGRVVNTITSTRARGAGSAGTVRECHRERLEEV